MALLRLCGIAVALAACAPAPQRPAEPAAATLPPAQTTPPTPAGAIAQKVVDSTNALRRGNGLAALKPNARLMTIAGNHARNMARQDKFGDSDGNGHVLDGKNMEYRIEAGGYQFGRVAENVGYQMGRADPAAAMMQGWSESPGHRRNMLLPDVTEIGMGAVQGKSGRWYFVQLLGRPPDAPQATRAPQ